MRAQKSLPHRQAVLPAGLLLCFCLPGLAQSHMTVRYDVHHDDSTFWYMQGETKTKT
jgi:hypothetical protein